MRCSEWLTSSVHQHLPYFLVITGMCEVKNAVAGQIKLRDKEMNKQRYTDNLQTQTLNKLG